MRQVADKV